MRTTPKLTASRRTRLANAYSAAPPVHAAEEARYGVKRSGPTRQCTLRNCVERYCLGLSIVTLS